MLSVLIPVYNFDIGNFIAELHKQAENCKKDFEILCYDDGSDNRFKECNKSVTLHANVKYLELPNNIGRSRIRNKLACDAKYDNLLFLDCDSKVVSPDFISNYFQHCNKKAVIYGGRSYDSNPPFQKEKYLRWFYGVKREVIPLERRKQFPYKSFMTNNFLIPKDIFLSIGFNEELLGYGHEDTLFGYALSLKEVPIIHIDNTLCHVGLETATEFLKKTEEGVRNLWYIINKNLIESTNLGSNNIKLLNYFRIVNKFNLSGMVLWAYRKFKNKILANLHSTNPCLFLFDLYKLGYLISLDRAKIK